VYEAASWCRFSALPSHNCASEAVCSQSTATWEVNVYPRTIEPAEGGVAAIYANEVLRAAVEPRALLSRHDTLPEEEAAVTVRERHPYRSPLIGCFSALLPR
jgi:hypothetical protein